MSFFSFMVERRLVAFAVVASIVALGLKAYFALPVETFPEVVFPVLSIGVSWPGADIEVLEKSVAVPIESKLSGIQGVEEITATISRGTCSFQVTFPPGEDVMARRFEVESALQELRTILPREVGGPVVRALAMKGLPVLVYALVSDGKGQGVAEQRLGDVAESLLRPRLMKVRGVSQVTVGGVARRRLLVRVEPARLQRYGLSLGQLRNVLSIVGRDFPGGELLTRDGYCGVSVGGIGVKASEVASMTVAVAEGAPVRVGDVAEVLEDHYPLANVSRINGRRNVMLMVFKAQDAKIVDVARRVKEALAGVTLPPGMRLVKYQDWAALVERQLSQAMNTAMYGAVMALIVVWWFLRSIAYTLVVTISIPLSVLLSFIYMWWAGWSFNFFSLGGLILALGMVVDDTIVVLENIFHKLQLGLPVGRAVREGCGEIGEAVAASTITTVVVLMPLFAGKAEGVWVFFRNTAAVFVSAILASLFVAKTVVPALSAWAAGVSGGAFSAFASLGGDVWYRRLYLRVLKWALRHPLLFLFSFVGAFLASFSVYAVNGFDSMMSVEPRVLIEVTFPEGASLAQKEYALGYVENVVSSHRKVRSVVSWMQADSPSEATMEISFREGYVLTGERLRKFKAWLAPYLDDVPDVKFVVGGMRHGRRRGMGQIDVELVVRSPELSRLHRVCRLLESELKRLNEFSQVSSSVFGEERKLRIRPREAALDALGITRSQVSEVVRAALFGIVASRGVSDGKEVDVLLKMARPGPFSSAPDEDGAWLKYLPLKTASGGYVGLGSVADFEWYAGPSRVHRVNGKYEERVTASLSPGVSQQEAVRILERLLKGVENNENGVAIERRGLLFEANQAARKGVYDFLVAVMLVYLVMAVQFDSLLHPLIVLAALPMGLMGSNYAFLVTGQKLSSICVVAVIMLVGIVVNDAIVLLDYLNRRRRQGRSLLRAVLEGGLARFRPIMMTSLTTIAGVLPMAMGAGEGGEMYRPIGVSLVGGLLFSTVLTLLFIPVLYYLAVSTVERVRSFVGVPHA